MNVIATFNETYDLALEKAILIYADSRAAIATVHDVRFKGDRPILLPGMTLTREMLDTLTQKLSGMPETRIVLSDRIVCADSRGMAWWVPARRRPIFFNTSDKAFNKAVNGKEVLHPPLLFLAAPNRLSVFALAENKRPAGDTVLCRAPYFNLYDRGTMCAGNARLPDVVLPSETEIWERAFFETFFTHSNMHGEKLTRHKGGHDGLWRELVKPVRTHCCGQEVFPREYLLPLDLTLEQAVNR